MDEAVQFPEPFTRDVGTLVYEEILDNLENPENVDLEEEKLEVIEVVEKPKPEPLPKKPRKRRPPPVVEDERNKRSYKIGRWFLLILALVSIPIDGYKLVDNYIKSEKYVSTSKLDTSQFYLGTLATHVVGFVAAIEHQLWLTIFCRFICTMVYQFEMQSKGNETIPQDPDGLKKYVDKKMFQKRGNPDKYVDPDDDIVMILFNISRNALTTL